jgi:hypothetical protein
MAIIASSRFLALIPVERNHKLGILSEFAAGRGRLMICTAGLPDIRDDPAARQLYSSILKYMHSNTFKPAFQVTGGQLAELLNENKLQ